MGEIESDFRIETFTQKIMDLFVQLNTEFRNTRIRHQFLICGVLFTRFIFSTFLDIVLLEHNQGIFLEFIRKNYIGFISFITSPSFVIFNLVFLVAMIGIQLGVLIYQLKKQENKSKISINLGIVEHAFNPLLTRYHIKLLTVGLYEPEWVCVKIFCFISVCLTLMLQFLFLFASTNPQTKNENLLVRQRRFKIFFKDIFTYLLLIATSLLISLVIDTSKSGITIIVLHLLISLIQIQTICCSYLFHNENTEMKFCVMSCIETTICFASFVASLTSEELIIGNMELVIISLTVFLYQGCKEYRGYRNHKCMLSELSSINQLNSLKLYIHILAQSVLNVSGDATKLDFFLNSLKNQHREQCTDVQCICQRKSNHQEEKVEFHKFLARNQLKFIMKNGENDFELTIFCCYFNLTYFNAYPDLLYKLNQIPKKEQLNYFECLQYQCFKREIKDYLTNKKNVMNAIETEKLQQQDQIILFFVKVIDQICSLKYLFWFSLGKKMPDFKVIYNSTKKQVMLINMIQTREERIYKEFLQSRAILQFVCLYEIFVKIKSKIPDKIKESLRNNPFNSNQELKVIKNKKFRIDAVMFDRNCVLFQSQVHFDNMGLILNVTKNITRVFGYTKQAIVGQSINEIMPKSMQKEHDALLNAWREKASWERIHRTLFIFAMTRDNVCFQSVIYLRIIQRFESINILATFVKANQNDYMIINEDNIIDGVGIRFKNILGCKIVKLPLRVICSQANELSSLVKKGQHGTISCLFYHVKGLEDEIEAYQYLKFQLNGEHEKDQFALSKNKAKQRSLMMTIEYKPYRMGSKNFMVLKLMDHYKPSLSNISSNANILENSGNNENSIHNEKIEKIEKMEKIERQIGKQGKWDEQNCLGSYTESSQQERLKLNLYESNPSIQTSQQDSNMSKEKIFTHLQQKFKKNSQFRCRSVRNSFLITLFFSMSAIGVVIFDYLYSSEINSAINEHSLEAARFIQRAVSLNLIYSRFQNIDNNASDMLYQVMRAKTEIDRVQNTILNMQSNLYEAKSEFLEAHLTMDVKWVSNNGTVKNILFSQYYTFFLIWCKELEERYVLNNSQSTMMSQRKMDVKNFEVILQYILQYIANNFNGLNGAVLQFLQGGNNFAKAKIGVLALILVIISIMLWRSTGIEQKQHQAVLKVLLSISERNCQQCGMYFRKITTILGTCREQSTHKGNEAQFFQKELIDKSKFELPLKQLQFEKDKFEKNKSLKYLRYEKNYKKYLVILLPVFIIPFLLYDLIEEHLMISKEVQFIQDYYHFMNIQIQCTKYFIQTKSEILKYGIGAAIGNVLPIVTKGILNDVFLTLIESAEKIYPLSGEILEFTDNLTLCEVIRLKDEAFYKYNCLNSTLFPFQRIKIYETNSLIETKIFNFLSELKQNKLNISEAQEELQILEQILNLAYISLCSIQDAFFSWLNSYSDYKMSCLYKFFLVLIIAFIILLVMVWWFSMSLHKKMNENCWRIIVIPESVIRNTKGAMRHIADVLRLLK